MSTTPARQPQGQPTGGQFAASAHPEPSGHELDSIEPDDRELDNGVPEDDGARDDFAEREAESIRRYNATGTAKYPPAPRSERQVFEFWKNVELSDEFLQNVENCVDRRDSQWYMDYRADHSHFRKKKLFEPSKDYYALAKQWDEEKKASYEAPRIPRTILREVVRLGHTYEQAFYLPPGERDKLLDHVVHIPIEGKTTPRKIYEKYRLDSIDNSFFMRFAFHPIHHS